MSCGIPLAGRYVSLQRLLDTGANMDLVEVDVVTVVKMDLLLGDTCPTI